MSIDHAILAALTALAAGLWVRRSTWAFKWESAATVNLAGILICLVCMMPCAKPVFDGLHFTGIWNVEDAIGHLAYLSGITVLAYVTLSRIELHAAARWRHMRLELPAVIVLPLLVGLFVLGSPDDGHARDLLAAPANAWLACYWLVLAASATWVLGHLVWALTLIARWDGQSAGMAKIYLLAVTVDCGSIAAKVLSLWMPGHGLESTAWVLVCAATVGYASAAIYGMQRIKRWLAWPPPRPQHASQPQGSPQDSR